MSRRIAGRNIWDDFGMTLEEMPATHLTAARGLPPARGRLASLKEWRSAVDGDLDALRSDRVRLQSEIDKLCTRLAIEAEALDAEVDGLLSGLRRGLLNFVTRTPAPDATTGRRLEVAQMAAERLDAQIAGLAAQIEGIDGAIEAAATAAVCELAVDTMGSEYLALVDRLRELMTILEGAAVATSAARDGRTVGTLPGVALLGQPVEVPIACARGEIEHARGQWIAARQALLADPRSVPALNFDRAAEADDDVPYEQLTAAERHLVDAAHAFPHIVH